MSPNEHNAAHVLTGSEPYRSEQGTVYTPGISAETVGSKALFFGVVTLPPGERTRAHVHEHHESAFYILSGEQVELWSGDQLQHRAVGHPGDYVYIPANVPHVAVNRGTQPVVFVGARNDPSAQESVVMLAELDQRVP
jgi:uncharacterized RmlC-like cupin family protein